MKRRALKTIVSRLNYQEALELYSSTRIGEPNLRMCGQESGSCGTHSSSHQPLNAATVAPLWDPALVARFRHAPKSVSSYYEYYKNFLIYHGGQQYFATALGAHTEVRAHATACLTAYIAHTICNSIPSCVLEQYPYAYTVRKPRVKT